jgi:hypothetical protein
MFQSVGHVNVKICQERCNITAMISELSDIGRYH